MITIWYAEQQGEVLHKVEIDLLGAALVIWDALEAHGFHMHSARP